MEQPPNKKHCGEPSKDALLRAPPTSNGIKEYETAFQCRLKSYFVQSSANYDLPTFCKSVKSVLLDCLKKCLVEHKGLKFNVFVDCKMLNQHQEQIDAAFKTKNKIILHGTDISDELDQAFEHLQRELEETQLKKSGWALHVIDGIRLRINKYAPLGCGTYICLPKEIESKKACINVQNTDNLCFKYAILSHLVSEHPQRVNKYRNLIHRYDFSCVNFPTPISEIKNFERRNNISINVFGLDEFNKVYPLKIVEEELPDHRDLLLISENQGGSHYIYIKNFERLVGKQKSHHRERKLICKRCFTHYDKRYHGEQKMIEHKKFCSKHKPTHVILPIKKPYLTFEHVERSMRVPFVIYCDFEAILKPIANCKSHPQQPYTLQYQMHEAMSYCVYLKCSEELQGVFPNLPNHPVIYRGSNVAKHLLYYLKKIAEEVSVIYKINKPMTNLTASEETAFQSARICFMCDKVLGQDRVKDHCHLTGRYRGAAHSICNLRYQAPSFLPVMFHNLSGYDSHFIVRELGYDREDISVIPNTEEKYISFSKTINSDISLRFLDTYRFLPSSLDNLARNLTKLPQIEKRFPTHQVQLLRRKGIFPYEYITNWEKLNETQLPPKSAFYSKLNNQHISDEDYQHACNVWKNFDCKTLGEYSDNYLKIDVLLLTDIFETFRDLTMQTHKLDPCHYYTLPGLSWDAMLRFTGITIELLTDYDQIMMIERGIRGGICQVSHRYVKANNQYIPGYNPAEESTYIIYQDCNNLYGDAMIKPLPYGEFQWSSTENLILESLKEDDDYGYIFEVDVEYPTTIHGNHNDLPFLPENINVNRQHKLIPHLNSRKNYVVHYMTLKQAVDHGLILIKINRALKFRQSRWLQSYILHNTKLRAAACNTFEKDLYKLYNNSVYGKTMENIRNRMNMKLVCDSRKIEKLVARPDFIDRTIYAENLAAIHLTKTCIKFDKPIYIGMSILDLSKYRMYEYHYDVMRRKYSDRIQLCYMDTDSFIYKIKTHDFYSDMISMLSHLDTSDYPTDHPCYSDTNKKVVGKFKDEVNGNIITEFVGLRAKMYALKFQSSVIKKAKGIQKAVLSKQIQFDDYINCLNNNDSSRHPMRSIRSYLHNVTTIETNKISLSSFDDKRIILEDGITTRAIGFNA